VNSYPLLQHAGAGQLAAIADIFAQARALGRPLVRTPAFFDAGDSPARLRDERGAPREAGLQRLDRVLAAAADGGVKLLLVLANNWRDFGGAPAILELIAPGEKLPKNAFWTDPRALANQLAYQRALATRINSVNGARYADDPTIFAWELANEARCESDRSGRTLAAWARRMSDGLRAAGVSQPIAWGGSGYLGRYGEDLRLIAADGGVDVLTLHMYASTLRTRRVEKVIAWGVATLRERSAVARSAGLPLLLEEVNWKPARPEGDAERARVLGAWLAEAERLGVGSLPWMIGERGRRDYDGYLIRPEHTHTNAVLRAHQLQS
jgi:mannan endo-1,4-beta-mannosidase